MQSERNPNGLQKEIRSFGPFGHFRGFWSGLVVAKQSP
jgi:hypothetical protein